MTDLSASFRKFAAYVQTLSGDEKGEAQILCDRFFQALGYKAAVDLVASAFPSITSSPDHSCRPLQAA